MTTSKFLLIATLLFPLTSMAAPGDEPERVVLGLDQFLEMYERNRKPVPTPPRDHAISSARYSGEVLLVDDEPHSAVFTGRFRLEVLAKEGWARVPILPATVALQSAKIGGVEAPVVIEDGFYTLVTDRRGAFDLVTTFAAAVTSDSGQSGFDFQLTGSGATDLTLAVPAREDLDFTIANAKLQSDSVVGGKRVVKAAMPSTGYLSVRWQREIPEAAKQSARVYSEVYTLVGIGDGVLRTTTTIQNTILFAGIDRIDVKIPKDMTVLDVQGTGIRDWKLGAENVLGVSLNYAAEGSYGLTVHLEKVLSAKESSGSAPLVVPLNVERTKGWVGVESRGNLEISGGEATGATPVDVRSLPAAILGITGQPVLLGYKYLGAEADIPLQVAEHEDVDVLVTLLDQATARTMWTPEGRKLTSVKYQIRNNRRQFLRLALPEGAELWSTSVAGRAVQPARGTDGRVMIPLLRSQAAGGALAAFEAEVVYVESTKATPESGRGDFKGELPRADAPTTYVAWTVYSPDGAKVRRATVDGSLRRVKYLTNPIPAQEVAYIETATPQVQQNAQSIADSGGMGDGAAPVPVSLPLQGDPIYFEKMLALDEKLDVEFSYKGLKKHR